MTRPQINELKNYIAFTGGVICSVVSGGFGNYIMSGVWLVMALICGCLTITRDD